MQHGLVARDDERVAGVVATLETSDRRRSVGQQIDDFSLALVAPLRADHYNVFAHSLLPDDVKHDEADRRDDQAGQAEIVIIHLGNANDRLSKQVRPCKGDHALDDQVDRKTRQ